MKLVIDGHAYDARVDGETVTVGDREFEVRVEGSGTGTTVIVNGRRYKVHRWGGDDQVAEINVDGKIYRVEISGLSRAGARPTPKKAAPRASAEPGAVTALMPGRVVRVDVTEGQQVNPGDVLLVLEAMKMENEIRAEVGGTVKNLQARQGASVAAGDTLLVIE